MADIRISALPNEAAPSGADFVAIDLATTRKTTVTLLTEAGRPAASQAEAEAGTNPTKAMTPLTTAQAIAFQGGAQFVPGARLVTAGAGLLGGGPLTADITLDVNYTQVQAFGDKLAALQALTLSAGDLIRASGVNTFEAIDIGTEGQALTVLGGIATWTSLPGTGDVLGPASAVVDNLTAFNNTNGKVIKDTGIASASMLANFAGHLFGFTLSNDAGDVTNDIGIAVGSASDDAVTPGNMIILASALIKRLDATWAVGTNQGMRASGAAIADTTYHIFAIRRPDTGVVDVAADTSATGANLAANTNVAYTQKRRIGSIIRASGAIRQFRQTGDTFSWVTVAVDRSSTAAFASALLTLTIPAGIVVAPLLYNAVAVSAASTCRTTLGSAAVGAATGDLLSAGASSTVSSQNTPHFWSNTSSQIYYSAVITGTVTANNLVNYGYIDTRGRLA